MVRKTQELLGALIFPIKNGEPVEAMNWASQAYDSSRTTQTFQFGVLPRSQPSSHRLPGKSARLWVFWPIIASRANQKKRLVKLPQIGWYWTISSCILNLFGPVIWVWVKIYSPEVGGFVFIKIYQNPPGSPASIFVEKKRNIESTIVYCIWLWVITLVPSEPQNS